MQALLPHAEVITRATHVRTTLLQASLRMVKANGHYGLWCANVDPAYREMIVESVAPAWLPIDAGLAHYLACDQFGLDDAALDKIGQSVGEQLQATMLGIAAKIARSAGMTPQGAATWVGKLWPRLIQGGSCQVALLGPKDLSVEIRASVLGKSRYFRGTCMGNVGAALKLLGTRALHVKALPYDANHDRFTMHVSYV